ncbi:MAG: c-type cytochrome, partial [Thermoanaerobaculia bacterium]|nr:c-type cytochrome [Thermoanaerobaculia bacterium]
HHGVWDYDLPAAPILHDIERDGETIKAVSLLTKQAMTFVFDRATGEPVWPIEERPVPTEMAVPGERLSPTQPFPTKPPPYDNLGYHEEDLIDFTPELRRQALEVVSEFVAGPMYTPPTLVGDDIPTRGTIVYPNYGGGANWNGGAVDVETNTLFVPTRRSHMAVGLRKADPSLTDWDYVVGGRSGASWLRLENGLPITKPPWALVTATDMNRGEHLWSRSIGGAPDWIREHPALEGLDLDFDSMGQISARPSPLVTKTLLFLAESGNIAGDPGGPMFRAYDKATGEVVAEIELPAKTSGAPMTYAHEGRQYIAVALSEREHPAELVALALPRSGVASGRSGSPAVRQGAAAADDVAATPEQLEIGRVLYAENCAECHGADGRGTRMSNAPPLDRPGSLADVRLVIVEGGPEMPALGAVMPESQIEALARFVVLGLGADEGL